MVKKGVLTVVSGFSGSGKGTVMARLLERYHNYALSVSATTREPRDGEIDGQHYFFKTREQFKEMIREGAFLEYAKYVANYYGTPRSYVEEMLGKGKDVILEIELQGAMMIREQFPDAVLIFITPPSMDALKKRLVGRATESMEVIQARLDRAAEEIKGIEAYDYLLVNDDLDECVMTLHGIIQGIHYRMDRNLAFVEELRQEIKKQTII